jgi:hypothetical protein
MEGLGVIAALLASSGGLLRIYDPDFQGNRFVFVALA